MRYELEERVNRAVKLLKIWKLSEGPQTQLVKYFNERISV